MIFLDVVRVLKWRLVVEYYCPEIEYIQGKNNIVAEAISWLPRTWNQNITHKPNYITETMSEINDTEEIFEGKFPVYFKIIDQYQCKHPGLVAKLKKR